MPSLNNILINKEKTDHLINRRPVLYPHTMPYTSSSWKW